MTREKCDEKKLFERNQIKMALVTATLLVLIHIGLCCAATPPKWPKSYWTQGLLELPYAEIKEPFTAYFDGVKKRSRIDYYGSMVYTKQIAAQGKKYGQSFKVAPMTTDGHLNVPTCFLVNGTNETLVALQPVLPNVTDFKYVGGDTYMEEKLFKFQMVEKIGNKKNTYTLWVKQDGQTPVRYEMMGYDSLLGSHYDKYYITYSKFRAGNITDASFVLPHGIKVCGAFPGPGNSEHRITMNPMQEYIHNDDRHIDDMFEKFKRTHNKKYRHQIEHAERKHQFRHNVRFIHSKNRAGLGYTMAVNHLTDLTDMQLKHMRGFRRSKGPNNALKFNIKSFKNVGNIPEQLDWRLYGAVTPVKDQAVCGSCWSFGTTGHIEGAYFMKTGELVRLSQQELMDCSWGEGNNACDGGEDFRAYEWIKKHGLATEEAYGPYLAQDSKCLPNVTGVAFVDSYVNIPKGDRQALRIAMANQGPISVGIDAAHKEMSFYSNGVYYNPACGNTTDDLDHAVLAVGYGYMHGQAYWLVKNSWSTYWGNDGYILMSMKDNNCGVATGATYVNLKK